MRMKEFRYLKVTTHLISLLIEGGLINAPLIMLKSFLLSLLIFRALRDDLDDSGLLAILVTYQSKQ